MRTFSIARIAIALGLTVAPGSSGAQDSPKIPPLALAEHGYFFVGGQYVQSVGKQVMAGQMYVEYLTPQKIMHPYPIVMIHGTAQTGSNFIGTPDGRPGWAHNFLARGYRVYVVDQVGRARSGADPQIYGPYMRFTVEQEESLFTAPEKYKLWPQAALHTQWPGGAGVAGNPTFDQFYASQVESIASAVKTEELMFPADIALLEKIGPAIVLTHSQSGVFGFKLADARPDLVKADVAVEPNGPPFYDMAVVIGSKTATRSPERGGWPASHWLTILLPLRLQSSIWYGKSKLTVRNSCDAGSRRIPPGSYPR